MSKPYFNIKLFVALFFAFIFFTVIGTLSHEGGHCVAAKMMGLTPALHYAYITTEMTGADKKADEIYKSRTAEIEAGSDYPEKAEMKGIINSQQTLDKIVRAGGPVQTMLTGSIAFILLIAYRKKILNATELNFRQWLLVFFSLFWLRQVANAVTGFIIKIPKTTLSGMQGDEIILAEYYGLPSGSIALTTAVIGLIISLIVIFRFIPAKQRFTFILAGLFGGVAGFISWLYFAGPWLMP